MNIIRPLLILLGLSLLVSCGLFGPDEEEISGITHTLEDGTVVDADPDDWQVEVASGDRESWVTIAPAYPNPVVSPNKIDFSIELAIASEVTIDIVDTKGDRVQRLIQNQLQAGNHTFAWYLVDDEGKNAPDGFYRAHITITDARNPDNVIRSYGDIKVE